MGSFDPTSGDVGSELPTLTLDSDLAVHAFCHVGSRLLSRRFTPSVTSVHAFCRVSPRLLSRQSTPSVASVHAFCRVSPHLLSRQSTPSVVSVHAFCRVSPRLLSCHSTPSLASVLLSHHRQILSLTTVTTTGSPTLFQLSLPILAV